MTRPLPNKTILRVLLAGVVLLLFCGAAVGAVGATGEYKVSLTTSGDVDKPYDSLYAAYTNAAENATITVLAEVTENSRVELKGTKSVTLDLNGQTIKASSSGSYGATVDCLISWVSSGKLTITDSSNPSTGKLDGANKTRVLHAGGTVEMNGGTITGGGQVGAGGGVWVNGTFIMNGGNIADNAANTVLH